MNKRSRAKKWAQEHPDAVMLAGSVAVTVGFVFWIRHAVKNADPYPVAYGSQALEDGKILVWNLFSDNTLKTMMFEETPKV